LHHKNVYNFYSEIMHMDLGVYFILFAVFGVAHEVLWTGLINSLKMKNPRLKGHSTVWMFFVYGAIAFIILFVTTFFSEYPWWFRGILYATLILCWEYMSGFMIKKLVGMAPWDYSTNESHDGIASKKRFHLHGLICLEYFPLWFVEGLFAEWIFRFLQGHLIV